MISWGPFPFRAFASRFWSSWRGGEIEARFLVGGVADEGPVVDEPGTIAVAQVIENNPPRPAVARGHLDRKGIPGL
jgi:hypothetical protein